MIDLKKKYQNRTWIRAIEVKEILPVSDSTLARYLKKKLIKSKRPYPTANYLYWCPDVLKLADGD